ncbi:NAD(P)/FAD-dependent oxidoreductase [Streptomyces sp. NPDC004609]|uniref:NAD(P)/FAD-dependent oxidoreductase n=1 Tax=Streptomyces sp. NPDC004609 TaxID=3364704 RepID=UPI003694D62E
MSEQQKQQRTRRVVVVGAGMAGVQTAVALREEGFTGSVTVIGAEPHQPYDRPPLSKAILLGTAEGSAFEVDFEELAVELRLGCEATAVRPGAHELDTEAGPVPYDVLVIASGAEPIGLPGIASVPGVHLLRTLDDAERLRPVLGTRHDIVVVGAGWIGAEFATAARGAGCSVTVVEAADRPLAGALPAEVTAPMAEWYAEFGTELITHARVAGVEPGAVVLADGRRIAAGAVVVGIGARPATAWLAGSGIETGPDGAITADRYLRTSQPDVYAVGDCASFPSARYGRRLLVHHWDNALQGPRTVAANVIARVEAADAAHGLSGTGPVTGAATGPAAGTSPGAPGEPPAVYDPVPYFWSEQFGRFVQYAGDHTDADTTVWRGDPADPAWTVLWLREGALIALLAVGRPRDLAQGRKVIQSGGRLDAQRAADPSVPLKAASL